MPVSLTLSFGAPAAVATIPMAVGDPQPAWPLAYARRVITGDFGDARSSERGGRVVARVHVAEDLPAPRGTVVFAPEAGRVVDVIPNFYKGSGYVLIQGDSGLVVVLGEIEPGSELVREGDRVAKGQAVAKVGRHEQLHFETYKAGTRRSYQWFADEPPPSRLLNPTEYLRAASKWLEPWIAPTFPPPPPPPHKPAEPWTAPTLPSSPPPPPVGPVLPPPPPPPKDPGYWVDDPEPVHVEPTQPRDDGGSGVLLLALALIGGGLA